MPFSRLPLLALAFATPAVAVDGGAIEVVVENVRAEGGMVMVQLCDRDHFLGKCALGTLAPARKGSVTVRFAKVPPGEYAVLAFHDANANGALDRWLGIPKEDLGFSGGKSLAMRPPRFKDSAFTHGTADQKLTVRLANYFG